MSAQLAIAEPRRIKATHRRRRKVAAGHFVQRYYDPAIGRFLSNDPVSTNANTGASFNRYWYANNNPYRFTDPDGRQAFACPMCQSAEAQAKVATAASRAGDVNGAKKAVGADGPGPSLAQRVNKALHDGKGLEVRSVALGDTKPTASAGAAMGVGFVAEKTRGEGNDKVTGQVIAEGAHASVTVPILEIHYVMPVSQPVTVGANIAPHINVGLGVAVDARAELNSNQIGAGLRMGLGVGEQASLFEVSVSPSELNK